MLTVMQIKALKKASLTTGYSRLEGFKPSMLGGLTRRGLLDSKYADVYTYIGRRGIRRVQHCITNEGRKALDNAS